MMRPDSWIPVVHLRCLALGAALAGVAHADVPRLMHYQGRLVTDTGFAVPGPVSIRARLYDGPTSLVPTLFEETHAAVPLNRGLFSILLGSQTGGGIPDSVLIESAVYLGVSVNGSVELSPRVRIATAPYSARTRSAEQLVPPGSASPAVTVGADGRVGIGAGSPDGSAKVDIQSTSQGFLLPRMTTAQRDAIAAPAQGLQIFNLDNSCLEFYIGGLWQSLVCGCLAPPAAPLAIDGPDEVCANQTGVVYSITPVFGATGYDWTVPPGAVIAAGDGTPSITVNFAAASGSIIVAARNGCGNSADRTLPLTVYPIPDAGFAYSPSQVFADGPVTFTPTLAGAAYSWTFTGGSPPTSTQESPVVTWAASGSYQVSLTVTANGCSDDSSQVINVVPVLGSCAAIKSAYPAAADGTYPVEADGTGGQSSFQAYCDMTADGGGWTLVMKSTTGTTFQYNASYWTTSNTLNPTDLTLTPAFAKYPSFNLMPFTSIRGCIASATSNCLSHTFGSGPSSALNLFSGSYRNEGPTRAQWESTLNYVCSYAPNCSQRGFNLNVGRSGSEARWGYAANNEVTCPDADATHGFGVGGNQNSSGGGGAENGCAYSVDSWLWVR